MIEPVGISVVIPTYQRCASVRRALEALARQTMAPTAYEVVVPIDGSDDGTREMIEGFKSPYRLKAIWQPNQGRAVARNAGVRLATGNLVIFLDDDMEPVPGFLLAHREAHPPGSRRAVVGPVPIPDEASSPPIVDYRRWSTNILLERLAQPGYKLGFRDVYTGNLSLPRDLLREVGGFDETFKLYGHEDYELALRLIKAGVELRYSAQAVAHQRYDKDFAALARDCVARGHTAVLFARKHPEVVSSLKLKVDSQGSRASRLVRSLMLWLNGRVPGFSEWVVRSMTWLEQRRPRRLHDYYTLVLDYFFWVGARSALQASQQSDSQPASSRVTDHSTNAAAALGFPDAVRTRVGLWLLVLFALASNVRLLGRAFHNLSNSVRPDEITRYEDRFQALRESLPRQTRVGYVSEPGASGTEDPREGARLAFKRYLLTQYALLPTIVLPGVHGPFVIANFHSASGIDSATTRGLTLIHDFGGGVMLFRTE